MNFLAQLLRGFSFIPAVIHGMEAVFGSKSGEEKKQAALSFIGSALAMTDAIAKRDIVDPEKFKEGLSSIIDGVVTCLNASAWAKTNS